MKNIVKHIAVLATAAVLMVANSFAQNYSPASLGAHEAVSVNPTTGVQVYPPSMVQLTGFNGDITNAPSATGTNYVITPGPQTIYIAPSTNVNIAHTTNKTANTFWFQRVFIKGDVLDRTLTTPVTWVWPTNTLDTNHIIGKISTIQSNTFLEITVRAIGTNVAASAQTYR